MFLLGTLPMCYVLSVVGTSATGNSIDTDIRKPPLLAVILAGFLVSITGPNIRVVLQNVCLPEIRATAFALFALTDDVGKVSSSSSFLFFFFVVVLLIFFSFVPI